MKWTSYGTDHEVHQKWSELLDQWRVKGYGSDKVERKNVSYGGAEVPRDMGAEVKRAGTTAIVVAVVV